jgi:hypothetical protein
MAWYLKFYECERCGETWHDEWSCLCNDRCPTYNSEIEPIDYEDLSVQIQPSRLVVGITEGTTFIPLRRKSADLFGVLKSADNAEHDPEYEIVRMFVTKPEAEVFAATLNDE